MNGHQLKGPDDKAEAELDVEVLTCHPITREVLFFIFELLIALYSYMIDFGHFHPQFPSLSLSPSPTRILLTKCPSFLVLT